MSNVMRLRKGTERATKAPVNTSVVIAVGDLIFQDTDGSAKPAASFTWDTSLAVTQVGFKAVFWGVSRDQRLGTEPAAGTILVDNTGCFEFPCAALGAEVEAGAFVGPDKAAGNALLSQQMVVVADAAHAIGRVAERALVGATVLQVELVSQTLFAGVV